MIIMSVKNLLVAGIVVCAGAFATQSHAALTLQYDTWPVVGTSVVNTGSTAVSGTLIQGSSTGIVGPDDGTHVPPTTAINFDDGAGGNNNLGSGIASNQTLNSLTGIGNAFTMGAWVNLDNTNGDNMVFGTDGGSPMHLGFRGDSAYFGFWGNDSNSASLPNLVGHWNYFSWVFNPFLGEQKIYENGVLISDSFNHPGPSQGGQLLTVGTNSSNGGDLAGSIDDARIYSFAFNDSQVATLFANASLPDGVVPIPTPEPASLAIWGVVIAGGLLVARRRKT